MKHLRVVLPMALAIGMFLGIANFVHGDTSGFTSYSEPSDLPSHPTA